MQSFTWRSERAQETRRAAARLAACLQPGDVIALEGELGAGKTEFVRGMAEGLGVGADAVRSPTFTLVHRYVGDRAVLVHVDAYRLGDAQALYDLGLETVFEPEAIVAIEWASRVAPALPEHRLELHFEHEQVEPYAGGEASTVRRLSARARGARAQQVLERWRAALARPGEEAACDG